MAKKNKAVYYPILPLRDLVVFPHMVVPLFVGRARSIAALEEVMKVDGKNILLVTQKNAEHDAPEAEDLYQVGILGSVLQLLKLPDGTVKVLVEGERRAFVGESKVEDNVLMAQAIFGEESLQEDEDLEQLIRSILGQFEQYVKLHRKIPSDVLESVIQIDNPSQLADTIVSHLFVDLIRKQEMLEIFDVNQRLEKILNIIEHETSLLQTEKRIRNRVKKQMEKTQREYYLNEQVKAIYKELGDPDESRDELNELDGKIKKTKLSKEAKVKAYSELKKLRQMNQSSSEATVIRNYLDWLLSIPWKNPGKVRRNLTEAENILNKEHYGLEKVKERILEYLAVQARVGKVRGQILCLVGPPGVGKTSLGRSIAAATGRPFVKVSLGGVRDESEIRGHRRTYIGSMPGKIIQGMKKAKASNPLFLLDEIDKMGNDWRGDPASALLEVLDPEQNTTFNDHYLEVDYDLSDVMFVTTANTLNMPQPLLDRMEIIRISGYTEDEKLSIANNYLLPKQMEFHGLKAEEMPVEDDIIRTIIRTYTRESGVRNLERELARLSRKTVRRIQSHTPSSISLDTLQTYLGIPRYSYGQVEQDNLIGVTTGLAWTEMGGDLLSIEAIVVPGKGKILITGKLGDVMQESVQAAISYVRVHAHRFGLMASLFEHRDIHIHVPEGATPKDGPSAGITICTSIVSALTGVPVHKDVAMTGEITLRGRVLPIGGLKEKMLAAHRGGIKTVLIPFENAKDLTEIPENVKEGLDIRIVKTVDDVLKAALVQEPKAISFEESVKTQGVATPQVTASILPHFHASSSATLPFVQ